MRRLAAWLGAWILAVASGGWIDEDTPEASRTTEGYALNGTHDLVFSDERAPRARHTKPRARL